MKRFIWFGVLLTTIYCLGCGPRNNPTFEKTVPVRGAVVLPNGRTLTSGLVTFHPKDPTKGEARGSIKTDGRFELGTYKINDGAMLGAYTVTVEPIFYDERGNPRLNRSLGIPPQYTDAQASTLTVEVKGEGDQDVKLQLR
ncbi:MAG TPA: hypothetical protein VH575_10280 [Gemmataceae bacterium]|jgi:hypothetical protein